MAKALGVLIIHGMGNQNKPAMEELKRILESKLGDLAEQVAIRVCFWEPVIQEPQDTLWQKIDQNPDLDRRNTRQWILNAFGDPAAYLAPRQGDYYPYTLVHQEIRNTLKTLNEDLGNTKKPKPLLVLAHSLGSAMISNYYWDNNDMSADRRDAKREKGDIIVGDNPFECMKSLRRFMTFGSNIPLFISGYQELRCIRLPKNGQWLNFFDPDDILGYPVHDIWHWDEGQTPYTMIEDIAMNAGWWPLSETPFSHNKYWTDGDLLRRVVREIKELIGD